MKSEKKKRDQKLTGQVCEKNKASLDLEPKPRPIFFSQEWSMRRHGDLAKNFIFNHF